MSKVIELDKNDLIGFYEVRLSILKNDIKDVLIIMGDQRFEMNEYANDKNGGYPEIGEYQNRLVGEIIKLQAEKRRNERT